MFPSFSQKFVVIDSVEDPLYVLPATFSSGHFSKKGFDNLHFFTENDVVESVGELLEVVPDGAEGSVGGPAGGGQGHQAPDLRR